MDNLTHSATGLFLSRCGLSRGVPRAAFLLIAAANVPDLDIVSIAGGPLAYLNYHRHLTHSLALLPVMALIPVLLVRLLARGPIPWFRAWAVSAVGVGSHLALDLTNIYGIRLFLPFSSRWLRLDQTSVIDVWIWTAFVVAFAGPFLVRLVNAEIGARRPAPGRGFAIFALAFLVLYNGGRSVLHSRAVAVLEARLYDGSAPERAAALPNPANPWRWRGLVETPAFYEEHEVDLLAGNFDPTQGRRFYKPEPDPALAAAARTGAFEVFLRFSLFPLWRIAPVWEPAPGTRVEAMDMRFGSPAAPGFVATAVLDQSGRPVREWFTFGMAGPR